MKIQIDIPEDLNKKLKHDKIDYGDSTLAEVIIENLKRYYQLVESDLYDKKGNPIVFE